MIPRLTTLLLLLLTGITGWAQDTAQQEVKKAPSAGQVLSMHYARTYQLAMRYNDYDQAKSALYNLYVENPQNDSILFSLSALYLETGKYPSAVLTSQDLLRLKPNHTGALEIMGVSYENLGLKDKALENYESLYLQNDDFQTLYKIAFLQYDLKRYNESKTNIDILLSKAKDDMTVIYDTEDKKQKEFPIKVALLNLKGMIAKDQGNTAEAKKQFQEALKIAPDFPLAKQNLGELGK